MVTWLSWEVSGYGTRRAYGDTGAVVVAFRLNPTQLRIANRISRSPDTVRTDPSHPEIARISEDAIVIEAFSVPASGR